MGFYQPSQLVQDARKHRVRHYVDLVGLTVSFSISLAIFVAGVAYFEHVERRFADII